MKKSSFILFIFLMTLFSPFTWAACSGTAKGTWNASTVGTYNNSNDNFSADYYTITLSQADTINLNIDNISSNGWFDWTNRTFTVSLYPNNACSSSAIWSSTITKGSSDSISLNLSAGTYTLQLTRSTNNKTGYSLNATRGIIFSGNNYKDFSILYTENLRGDIRQIGNTILGRNANGSTTCPGNTTNNADDNLVTRYWDVDGDSSTFNSSSSDLQIPTGATIKKAYLYWQGRTTASSSANATQIKLKAPGKGYVTLNAPSANMHWDGSRGSYFPYQGSVEITNYMNGSGTYTVGDITTYAGGYLDRLGAYGAWSIVVVYTKDDETLRNITIYDGYKTIATNNSENFTLSGFLTPSKGAVNSKFLIFTGEGDVDLKGDYVTMNGTRLTRFNDNSTNTGDYNTFNASITKDDAYVTTRQPSCQNNLGIDIHTYDVGSTGLNIIKNNNTSASLTIGTNSDVYYLSVFAFATQLYEPRVCYYIERISDDSNKTIFENKKFIDSIEANKNYTFDMWISNMKRSTSDTDIETAKLVKIDLNMTTMNYQAGSTSIKNIGKNTYDTITDNKDSDIGEHNATTNLSTWRLGTGATGTQGGTLDVATDFTDNSKKAYVKLVNQLPENNQTTINLSNYLIFKASFKTDSITIDPNEAQTIEQCIDFNTTASVIQPPLGLFNVVNYNGSLNNTSLYTQIAGQDFQVKVLALNSDYSTLKNYTGDVNLSLIAKPAYIEHNDAANQELCNAATPLSGITKVTFTGNSEQIKTLNYGSASRDVAFQIAYTDANNVRKYVCSQDSFSIRPATYTYAMTPDEEPLIGGANYTLTVKAITSANAPTSGYDQVVATNSGNLKAILDLIIPEECTLPEENTPLTPMTFNNGISTFDNFIYNNVGDVNVTILDNDWTANDQKSGDCLIGSTSSTPNADGKVGCQIKKVQTFTFSPKKFMNTLELKNFNDGNFTYLSNDENMSAKLLFTTTAVLDDNLTAATNYTKKCYAKDITYTVELNATTQDKRNRIRYFEDESTSNFENNNTVARATFSSTEGNFTNGTASNLKMFFNFTRAINMPDEPFRIFTKDFNITQITDTSGVTGTDFNRTNDQNVTHYYGRVYSTDYKGESPITTTIRYELYCKDCNRTDFNITGVQSPTSINWYQNELHDNNTTNYGNVTQFSSIGTTKINNADTAISGIIITDGIENNTLSNATAPYTDRIQMRPSSWLLHNLYNPNAITNDFNVEFISSGNWAGDGELGKTVDINATKRTNRRMEW